MKLTREDKLRIQGAFYDALRDYIYNEMESPTGEEVVKMLRKVGLSDKKILEFLHPSLFDKQVIDYLMKTRKKG